MIKSTYELSRGLHGDIYYIFRIKSTQTDSKGKEKCGVNSLNVLRYI